MSSTKKFCNKGEITVENTEHEEFDDFIIDLCPECSSTDIITDYTRSEKICSNCGYVLEERIINSVFSFKYKYKNNKY